MTKAYRQGDVILLCDAQLPADLEPLPDLVLAHGEVTGHKHQIITGGERVKFLVSSATQRRFLQVEGGGDVVLGHEEHGHIKLGAGTYEVRIQREYEPNGWRAVAD